jgi:biopolymer transport protein ExbD
MAFGGFNKAADAAPMAEINMVPLIDVMLVMLVIFIVTAPLLTHSVKIDLPKASSQSNQTKPDNVQLAIAQSGQLFWNGEPVDAAALDARLTAAAALSPQPELHLRADRHTEYQRVAEVMAAAARARLTRIGFISEPESKRN